MNLESVFFITQIVAAIAVIISLFYVAYEVRHNTKALRLSTYQSVVDSSMKILHSLYSSNETAIFYHRCLFENAELNGPEKLRWHAVMITLYRHWDNLLYQNLKGSLEDEMWLSYDRTMTKYLEYKSWADWFKTNSKLFSTNLQQLVGDKIKKIQVKSD